MCSSDLAADLRKQRLRLRIHRRDVRPEQRRHRLRLPRHHRAGGQPRGAAIGLADAGAEFGAFISAAYGAAASTNQMDWSILQFRRDWVAPREGISRMISGSLRDSGDLLAGLKKIFRNRVFESGRIPTFALKPISGGRAEAWSDGSIPEVLCGLIADGEWMKPCEAEARAAGRRVVDRPVDVLRRRVEAHHVLRAGVTFVDGMLDLVPTARVARAAAGLGVVVAAYSYCLFSAIAAMPVGSTLGAIGAAVTGVVEAAGLSIVREYTGHGIGTAMHEEPAVPNYPTRAGDRLKLKEGLVLAIEPMVNLGRPGTRELDDGWTVVTLDGSRSAHFEHTIAITDDGPEVLTLPA